MPQANSSSAVTNVRLAEPSKTTTNKIHDASTVSFTLKPLTEITDSETTPRVGFTTLKTEQTNVDFFYKLDLKNPLKRLYSSGFICGGIALGDIDGDQRPDIFLANGPQGNQLYRQTSNLQFEDITKQAKVDGGDAWGAGTAMVDIDNDGDLDIYVCNYDSPNQLFLNDKNGNFHESAQTFGINVVDASLMPAFCDYDRDGDLDLFVLTNRYYRAGGRPQKPPFGERNGKPYVLPEYNKYYGLKLLPNGKYHMDTIGRPNHLLRNNGDGTFSDVSKDAGILAAGHGLSVTWWDCNHDGWPDIYVGNDYNDPDHLYRNNGDGTFTDILEEAIPHTSWFSMGSDFGDLNNDGLFDFLVVDMSATTHYSQKTTMGAMNAEKLALVAGPPPQIMKNALYINSGTKRFAEAAELAGLADSDWSWGVKLQDLDNDGRIDVLISNGMVRNFNNSDKQIHQNDLIGQTEWDIYEDRPTRPEKNLVYRNLGNLNFKNTSADWSFDKKSMSYATAHADLDLDGDLDLVMANLEDQVSILRNDTSVGNRLLIALRGTTSNHFGIGATVTVTTSTGQQIRQLSPQTGFLSSNEPLLHFGLGDDEQIEQITVTWPSGTVQEIKQIAANNLVTIFEPGSASQQNGNNNPNVGSQSDVASKHAKPNPWFSQADLKIPLYHSETEYDDFARQPLLPNKLSQLGPGIAVADVDGDGDEDFYVGGAAGLPGHLVINQGEGKYALDFQPVLREALAQEEMGVLWFDSDGDDDLDLYVVSGGVETDNQGEALRDRLYLNDGNGKFSTAPPETLPDLRDSGSIVTAADFDRDGDLDLFVASRVIPGDYPASPASRLLENRGGKFTEITESVAPALLNAGMVTSAVWSDADADGWIDLLLTTEWGPVKFLRNDEGQLVEKTETAGLAEQTGWWNGIAARDLDGDGDIDYIATNFGLNTKYHPTDDKPVVLYYGDFDNSGTKRMVEAEYEHGVLLPIRGKSCSSSAMPHLRKKFTSYHDFALASLEDIYTPQCLGDSEKFEVNTLASVVLINDGAGHFTSIPLPTMAQISPSFGVVTTEVNGDQHPDIYLVQNFFTAQVETGRMDGGLSLLLLGQGDGHFRPVPTSTSGLAVPGDAKSLALMELDAGPKFLVGVNDQSLLAFQRSQKKDDNSPQLAGSLLQIRLAGPVGNRQGIGAHVQLKLDDGSKQAAEIHAGSGYLSQSTSTLTFGVPIDRTAQQVDIRWPDGSLTNHAIPDTSNTTTKSEGPLRFTFPHAQAAKELL